MNRTNDNQEASEEFKDDLVSDWVKNGARTLPNANFEDQMMLAIQAEVDCKKEVSAQLMLSLRFFAGALLFGIGLAIMVLFGEMLKPYDAETLTILALFFMGVIGIMNIDNYRRLIKKYV